MCPCLYFCKTPLPPPESRILKLALVFLYEQKCQDKIIQRTKEDFKMKKSISSLKGYSSPTRVSREGRESADSNHLMADENSLIFCFSVDDLWYWVTAIFYHRILQYRWMKSQAYGRCWSIECSIWHSRIIFAFTIVNMPTVIVNHCNIFNLKGKNGIHFTINVFYEKMSSAVDEAR